MTAAVWDSRIQRAELLASRYPFAAEILRFYQHIARFQKDLSAKMPETLGRSPVAQPGGNLRSELNLVILLPHFPSFLALIERVGPAPLASGARRVAAQSQAARIAAFSDFWARGGREDEPSDPAGAFLYRAFLQPYAEFLAARSTPARIDATPRVCPACSARPVLGVLRPEGDGGKRSLLCSFCSTEWDFRRILCAACGEEQEQKLPVYVSEQFPHIRVECCDTCKHDLRTIDLTKDGHAVPVVDDLAAIPLGLWAAEHGYTRLESNLLGT